jgi:hypothetical protein
MYRYICCVRIQLEMLNTHLSTNYSMYDDFVQVITFKDTFLLIELAKSAREVLLIPSTWPLPRKSFNVSTGVKTWCPNFANNFKNVSRMWYTAIIKLNWNNYIAQSRIWMLFVSLCIYDKLILFCNQYIFWQYKGVHIKLCFTHLTTYKVSWYTMSYAQRSTIYTGQIRTALKTHLIGKSTKRSNVLTVLCANLT